LRDAVQEAYEMDKFGLQFEGMSAEMKARSISLYEQKASCSLNLELFHKFIDTPNEVIMMIMQYIAISNFFWVFSSLDSSHVSVALQRM
jgi:hypothetical protein